MEIFKYEICSEELKNDTLYDAIHYRNIDVENRLGVKLKQFSKSGSWDDRVEWFDTIATAVNTNSSDYDVASFMSQHGSNYVLQGLYYNMNQVSQQYGEGYIDLEKPWWNQSIIKDCTVYDALFFLAGDITVSGTYGAHPIWFNKDLFNQEFPDAGGHQVLYDLVDDQKWTIDKMANYVSEVWTDTNNSGNIDEGDVVGLKYYKGKDDAQMESWTWAMGIEVLEKDGEGGFAIANFATRLVPALEKVKGMYQGEGSLITETPNKANDKTRLVNGNVLFEIGNIGGGSELRNSAVNYGALPMPKYDEEQEDYANGMWSYGNFLTILSNVPMDRAVMISAVLEVMAAESYKQVTPAFYDKVITGVYSKEPADARMLDIALRTCSYTFECAYAEQLDVQMIRFFWYMNADPQTTFDANYTTTWPTKLETLLLALDDVAYNG